MISTIISIGGFLKRKLAKSAPEPVVVIGTDYLAYHICETLNASGSHYSVAFVIDEEPWNHRTQLAGAELRYPSELAALIKRYDIKAVICTTLTQKDFYTAYIQSALKGCCCAVVTIFEEADSQEIEQQILQAARAQQAANQTGR